MARTCPACGSPTWGWLREIGWGFAGVTIAVLLFLLVALNVPMPTAGQPFTVPQLNALAERFPGGHFVGAGTYQRCENGVLVRYLSDQRRVTYLPGCWN